MNIVCAADNLSRSSPASARAVQQNDRQRTRKRTNGFEADSRDDDRRGCLFALS
jgi:hypothetical protein